MTNKKRYYRRPAKSRAGGKQHGRIKPGLHEGPQRQADYLKPDLDPGLRATFRKIGVPEHGPFKPDPFQLEALDLIKDYDVLVSAPTGSGKTWIASQAIHSYLARALRVWYASPLKALSNSIYQEFCREFGPSYCGILTGDRKENPNASVIVGTTEILRNQLYDSMHEGTDIRADLVILDEAHYLSDPDRGVVWEEVLIYLPSRVRLLLLSATISNAEEVCGWLKEIRGTPNRVVLAEERPVPMEMLFLFPDGLIVPLGSKRGLSPKIKKFLGSKEGRRRSDRIDFGGIIKCLRKFDLLPAIFFLKSRADCNRALMTCSPVKEPPEDRDRIRRTIKIFLRDFPHLEGHRQIKTLLDSKVGSHHGGQLPYWKMLVEKMMNSGDLDAIFSTSTVAAGVNFPARTVVLVQSDRYNGHEFLDLTATDLHQMIGRAGRRGKDNIGFALIVPGRHQDPKLINELMDSQAEPVLSRIHINFSMTLNLLLSHTPLEVKDLLERSFAAFQEKESGAMVQRRWDRMLSDLRMTLPKARCDTADPYEIQDNIQKRSELKEKVRRINRDSRYERMLSSYKDYLKRGRVLLHKNGNIYVVFHTYVDHERFICEAFNIKKKRNNKQRFRLKRVDLNQIKAIFDYRIDLPKDTSPGRLRREFDSIRSEDLKVLKINLSDRDTGFEASDEVKQRISSLPCEDCPHLKTCHGKKKGELKDLLRELRTLAMRMEGMGSGLWLGFRRHVRFLKETGFVDETDRLTPDGFWASKLRLDQPLLIAEAIRKRAYDDVSPEILAGGLAPFVWDRGMEVGLKSQETFDLAGLEEIFYRILDSIEPIRSLKAKRGFDSPQVMYWPAAVLFMWAKGVPWDRLLDFVSVDEGDLTSLIMRTADHLRQVANLSETHPRLASVAEDAVELILREPVYIY
ncbi:MAG: DEAD/DEAH box helicase [Deltaproteobacteria bacterium]|nr:DEAD/DEAH box helicase [Deltaproteobacteria bacterium]